MPRRLAGVVLGGSLLLLGGCGKGTVQEALGMDKRAPDEFAVVSRAPLIVPPDYQLRPPRPGAPRPQVGTTSDQARARLTGRPAAPAVSTIPASVGPAPAEPEISPGETALMGQAATGRADPEIRRRIATENVALMEAEGELYTRLMRWQQPIAIGHTVDASAETERLLANRVEGKPPTEGDTPTVVDRRQSPLGGLVEKVF